MRKEWKGREGTKDRKKREMTERKGGEEKARNNEIKNRRMEEREKNGRRFNHILMRSGDVSFFLCSWQGNKIIFQDL